MSALIFFDIDGTLCGDAVDPRDERSRMPDSTRRALRAAQANGHKLFINTGRTPALMEPFLEDVGFDGLVMSCGAYIRIGDEVYNEGELSHEESVRIRNAFLEAGIPAYYEGNHTLWFEKDQLHLNEVMEHIYSVVTAHGASGIVDPDDPDFRFVKLLAFSQDAAPLLALNDALGHPFDPIDRGGSIHIWELATDGYSKATGIDRVRERLGVGLEDCYAIGDSTNDLPMLLHVPNSIAMGNACDEVKQACTYVTTAQDQDGILNALKHYGLI